MPTNNINCMYYIKVISQVLYACWESKREREKSKEMCEMRIEIWHVREKSCDGLSYFSCHLITTQLFHIVNMNMIWVRKAAHNKDFKANKLFFVYQLRLFFSIQFFLWVPQMKLTVGLLFVSYSYTFFTLWLIDLFFVAVCYFIVDIFFLSWFLWKINVQMGLIIG